LIESACVEAAFPVEGSDQRGEYAIEYSHRFSCL